MASGIDDELAALRERRMSEIQSQLNEQAAAQAEAEIQQQAEVAALQQLDTAMKTILTPEARSRLASLSLVNANLTTKVKSHLVELERNSRIQIPVNDSQLKKILAGLSQTKREVNIRRI